MTRDRKELTAEWAGVPVRHHGHRRVAGAGDALEAKVSDQAERALAEADVVLMVVDVTTGVTEEDMAAAKVIRRAGPPVRLVVNKVDGASREAAAWEFVVARPRRPLPGERPARTWDGRPARRGRRRAAGPAARRGTEDRRAGHATAPRATASGTPSVAIIGRPNVGKSTLFNRLLGEERSVVHDLPGTTRDAIDTVVETPDGPVCFIDTAGLRRPSRTDRGTEQHATMRALRALERADVAVLVIDATVGASHQDQRLAERIGVSGCPAIVALNKWDQVPTDDREDVLAGVGDRLAFLGAAPVLRMSACPGKGVHRILPALRDCDDGLPPTGPDRRAQPDGAGAPAAPARPRASIRYIVQGAIDPPTFTLFSNGRLPQTWLRYIERGSGRSSTSAPTPMKLRVRIGGQAERAERAVAWCEECDTLSRTRTSARRGSARRAGRSWPNRSVGRSPGTSRRCSSPASSTSATAATRA